jgi:hypothetical protein
VTAGGPRCDAPRGLHGRTAAATPAGLGIPYGYVAVVAGAPDRRALTGDRHPKSGAANERILAEKDPARLERWHERAIFAASVADVLDEPS